MNNKPLKNKKEYGIAVIMSLGMMALLLVLGMAFAASARTELQVSTAYRNINLARQNADDSLNTALHDVQNMNVYSYLENEFTGQRSAPLMQIYANKIKRWREIFKTNEASLMYTPGLGIWTNSLQKQDQAGLPKALNYRTGFMHRLVNEPAPGQSLSLGNAVAWRHIRDWDDNFSLNKSDSDVYIGSKSLTQGGAIKGRSFYVTGLDSFKLDPNFLARQKYLAEKDYHGNGKYGHILSFDRLLKVHNDSVTEAHSRNYTSDKMSKLYSSKNFERKNDKYTHWESLEEMWNAGCFEDNEEDAQLLSGLFSTYAQLGDIEAFQLLEDNDKDNQKLNDDNTRMLPLHRFCLTDLADSSMTVEKLLDPSGVKPFWKNNIPGLEVNDTTINPGHMTTCIPWLSRIRVETDTDFKNSPDDNSIELQKQIAANLLDYCDEDDEATTDGTSTNNYADSTYCGLEKAPYIKKIVFVAEVTKVGGNGTVTGLNAEIGLLNIYDEDVTVSVRAFLNGVPVTSSSITVSAHDIAKTELTFSNPAGIPVTDADLPDMAFIVMMNGVVVDIVAASAGKLRLGAVDTTSQADPSVKYHKSCLYFPDPRANTSPSQGKVAGWKAKENATDDEYIADKPNPGSDPSNPDGYSDVDKEVSADGIRNVSTAYIRNGPMKTMWELGAIHRGEPFRTLRLTEYDSFSGTYTGGDARLYDEIKLNAETFTHGKPFLGVTLGSANNAHPYENFECLFKSVLKSDDESYDLPDSLPTDVTDDSKYVVSDGVWEDMGETLFSDTHYKRFNGRTRGRIAEKISVPTSSTTDKEQEEIYGKIVHMFTDHHCYYTIMTTGEEVKRMEMSTTMENKYKTWQTTKPEKVPQNWVYIEEEGWYKILGRVKIKATVKRNMITEQIEVVQQEIIND